MSIGVILTIIFTVLKLTGFITWTWPVVFIPLICEAIVDVLILFGAFVFIAILSKDT